jgi:N-acetylmuramoyl-L-alanine amidase
VKKVIFLCILGSLFYLSCGTVHVYYVKPTDWSNKSKQDSTIKYFSQYLNGWKFFIDPGHGGEDRRSKGPKGDVVEADINLRVSLALRDYLERAGAKIVMSRDKDVTVTLSDRSLLANASGCDIFISVHHNSVGNDDRTTNYTSTWYHAQEGHKDFDICNWDIAKYIQRDLAYVMGNNGPLASFDGTLSDFIVYPNNGFSVLKNSKIPAVLIEGSFFSNTYEEQRLKRSEFNKIQAWGIFRGIGKYVRAGVPKLEFVSDTLVKLSKPEIGIKIKSEFPIEKKNIVVTIDNFETNYIYNENSNIITVKVNPALSRGDHLLNVVVTNNNGNHSFPFKRNIKIIP